MVKSTVGKLIIILLFFQANIVFAQETTGDSLVLERIQYIQQALNQSKPAVNRWWYGWLAGYSAATVAQGSAFLLSHDKATRQDLALGTAIAFVGVTAQWLMPLNTGKDAEKLSLLPETTTDEQLRKLAVAEQLFKSDALKEKTGRSWQIHALNEAVNLSSGLITWIGFKRSVWDGVSNFLLNSIVTETQIWTQPTRTLKDYKNYCRKYKSGMNPLANKPQPEYVLRTYPGGVSLSIVF